MDYSKKCIITPTFIGHFEYLENYLKSFRLNVEDKDDCIIYFIINASENNELQKIISKYNEINIKVLFFEDILEKFNIKQSPAELLEKYGKFSFQALKKFYGMLYLQEYQKFLVLDTESIWLNKTNMKKMFSDFFEVHPFIIYSNIDKRLKVSLSNEYVTNNINYVLSSNCDKWFVEQYVRFWDVNILKDLFKEHGSCLDIVNKIYEKELHREPKLGLFESVLYDQYIYEHAAKYKYNCIDLDKECEKYLKEDIFCKYRKKMAKVFGGSCGLLESSSMFLDKYNYRGFAEVFKNNYLNVIRIETELQNYKWQKYFLDIVKPNILTCSQENLFGVNRNIKNFRRILRVTPVYKKFMKHFLEVIYPFKVIFKYFFNHFIATIFYFFRLIIELIVILPKLIFFK